MKLYERKALNFKLAAGDTRPFLELLDYALAFCVGFTKDVMTYTSLKRFRSTVARAVRIRADQVNG